MERSAHQFIYGYNGKEREDFLKNMVGIFPVKIDQSKPMGVYLTDFGLPKKAELNKETSQRPLAILGEQYCYFSIATNVVDTTLNQTDERDLNKKTEKFLRVINDQYLNKNTNKINNLKELRNIFDEVRNTYLFEYEQYTKTAKLNDFIDKLPHSFIDIGIWIKQYKEMLNTNSHFALVIDHQEPISLISYQAINGLVSSRINGDIAMKVACEPNGWETYCNLNGTFVERTHDYQEINLDDSTDEHLKRLRKKYQKLMQ